MVQFIQVKLEITKPEVKETYFKRLKSQLEEILCCKRKLNEAL